MDKTGEDWDGLRLGKFEKRRPTFFQIYVSLHQKYHLHGGKIILSCCVALVFQIKTLALPIWRLELVIDKIKQNYLK